MKKITKLLPAVLALMLISPAFAATATTQSSTQTITVPKFINITKGECTETANASFNDDYTTINLDTSLKAAFHVVTNNPDEQVKLTVTAPTAGGEKNAVYGNDATKLNIIFTNTGSGERQAQEAALTNIMGSPDKTQNANAIAFTLTPAVTPVEDSGAEEPTPSKESDGIKYPLKNGAYDFTYTVAQTAVANTFSTHDTDGTYKATLTLSQVGP